jgi:hypothetical protein
MPMPIKPTPEKFCELCSKKLERKRYPNGDLECLTLFVRRRFCDMKCSGIAQVGQKKKEVKWSTAHHHARRLCPSGPCTQCGSPEASDVHHKNGDWKDNSLDNLARICRSCHNREHRTRGSCQLCGKPVKGLGYCDKHYKRFVKWGDPRKTKQNQHTEAVTLAD